MIYFCKTAKRISIGIIVSVKTANTCCHSLEYRPKKLYTAKGIVHFWDDPRKNRGIIKLFHMSIALIMILVSVTGFNIGISTRKKSCNGLQPSMIAASSISRGTPFAKLQKVMMVNGRRMAINRQITAK